MNETYLYQHTPGKDGELNVWLAFPGIYSFGMSSIGFLSIFRRLDECDDIFIERIFTDTKTTTIRPSDLDVFGFSVSFELDFLSIFKIIEQYKIPFKSEDRDESYPLIFGGGPVLTANPEPFCDFFDFIMVGDAEDTDVKIMRTIKENKSLPKQKVLELISQIDGVYVPSQTTFDKEKHVVTNKDGSELKVKKTTAKLPQCVYTPILSEESYFSNTFIIEIARGCQNRCGFCLASYLNLPVRFCDYEKIIEAIELGLKHTNKIALLGALICAHPNFDDICDYILKKIENGENVELSVSSLRADFISPKTIQTLVKCGQKNATIAIEAGSERLRKVINKNLTEEEILKSVEIAQKYGLHGLKIYAMIGLPTETYEDLDEMIALIKKIKKTHKGFDITMGFSTFVPKAQTPFQFVQREDTKSLEKKYEYLKKEFHKIGVKIRCSSVKWDYIQSIISRGDRRLCDYLIEVYRAGCKIGCFKNTYKSFVNEGRLPDSDEFAISQIPLDSHTPWDFIEIHQNKSLLTHEYNRLLS